jgi:protein O-GlcNAc transferase
MTSTIQTAMDLHRQGRLKEAEVHYRNLLASAPSQFETLHLYGILKLQQGEFPEALTLISRAIDLNPSSLETRANLAAALVNLGRSAEAVEHCNAVLVRTPQDPGTLFNRGIAMMQMERNDDAFRDFSSVLAIDPNYANALYSRADVLVRLACHQEALADLDRLLELAPYHADALAKRGTILARLGRDAEAEATLDRALQAAPDHVAALANRGLALAHQHRFMEAFASLDRALTVGPDHADAHINRGHVLTEIGRPEDALECYRQATALDPNSREGWCSLGMTEARLGRHDDALASLERGVALSPDDVGALICLGDVLRALGRHDEALSRYDRALTLAPDDLWSLKGRSAALIALDRPDEALESLDAVFALVPPDADMLSDRGGLLRMLNRHDEALADLNRALQIEPDHVAALNHRGAVLLEFGRPAEAVQNYRQALAINPAPDIHSNLIAALSLDPVAVAADHQAERLQWNEQYARVFTADIAQHRNVPDPDRRLRIGYVSGSGRRYTAALARSILFCDSNNFEAVVYGHTAPGDAIGARMRLGVDLWRDIAGCSDEDVAQLIRQDNIDILVDPLGHRGGQRLLIFARKPAPIQVTGWGDPTGTGLATMDYLLADPVLVPPDQRHLLVEGVYDLPSFLGYWTPDQLPDPSPLPATERGFVTFGSFNGIAKIQDPLVRIWAEILRVLPEAMLVIQSARWSPDSARRVEIEQIFADEGVAEGRVEFRGASGRADQIAVYRDIDIALDPFPCGGAARTLDALWMGVPVVTRPGRTIASRLAAASLSALGLTDFIADGPRDYVDRAVALADDIGALAYLRLTLRGVLANSAIGDPVRYTRSVEAAYRAMWREWCASTASRSVEQAQR